MNFFNVFYFLHLQRARLLDNTEQVERTGKRLEHGYRTCIETGIFNHLFAVMKRV